RAVALTYEVAGSALSDTVQVIVTGNPVRSSVFTATRAEGRNMLSIPDDALMLLVFGGSLGARHINSAVAKLKTRLLAVENLYIVQVTGPKELETVQSELELTSEEATRWKLFGYQDRMGETLAASDMAISRAGATSLAEISARKIPAMLVPFPFATEDHQTTNAKAYVERGAAFMMADDEVESDAFAELLFAMIEDPAVRERMRVAAESFKTENAASRLADVVIAATERP
ncbi:MAG: glycosyltransferase, partial [Raoultibacter sp.]